MTRSGVTVTPLGDAAVRCEVASLADAHALHAALLAADLPVIANVVVGWGTVVVMVDAPAGVAEVMARVGDLDLAQLPRTPPRRHTIDVVYDGPDLVDVARMTGLSAADVVARHTAPDYTVAFLGFAPGFPYLAGLDPALAVARHPTARSQVPAGAVGIADDVTGIYPSPSPGGWQIIGRAHVRLFDVTADPPALLAPGDVVRFAAVG